MNNIKFDLKSISKKFNMEISGAIYSINHKANKFFLEEISYGIKKIFKVDEKTYRGKENQFVKTMNLQGEKTELTAESLSYSNVEGRSGFMNVSLPIVGELELYFTKILLERKNNIETILILFFDSRESHDCQLSPCNNDFDFKIFRDIKMPIVITRKDKIIFCNRIALIQLGYKNFKDLIFKDIRMIIKDFDDLFGQINLEKLLTNDYNESITFRVETKRGKYHAVNMIVSKVKSFSYTCIMYSVVLDYTYKGVDMDKKDTLHRIKKESQNILKTELFSNLSHELKTPINIILASVQLVMMKNAKGVLAQENISRTCTIITQNAHRLLRLSNNIIDANKMEIGEYRVEMKRVNIARVIMSCIDGVKEFAYRKNINIYYDSDIEELYSRANVESIERIMFNLISNAIKFTKDGEIEVRLELINENYRITVKDTGVGIPIQRQKDVFNRFVQVDKSLNRNAEGSGIGLAIVKSLVELHGGEIHINPEYCLGTEFDITIPLNENFEDNESEIFYNDVQEYFEKASIECSDVYV